jgi:tripartite-type tricarboxylate transporter receptor subunit TctC
MSALVVIAIEQAELSYARTSEQILGSLTHLQKGDTVVILTFEGQHSQPPRHLPRLVAATGIALFPYLACAQGAADYPNKPVRVIVSSSAGGGSDIQARMLAQKLSESTKQQFQVDNRPGAGDTIGTGLAAKAAPDGYTLLLTSPSFTIAPAMYPKFPVDPLRDFAAISLVASAPMILLVHPSLPVKSVKEVIALAKSTPATINIGTGPAGTSTHLVAAAFASAANIKVTLVPYQEVSQRYGNAIAGHTQMIFAPVPGAQPFLKSGRLRPLAVTSAKRSSVLPDLPTVAEGGVRDYEASVWYGLVAPAGTPINVINKLHAEIVKAIKSPDVIKRFADEGADAIGSTPEQFEQFIAAEVSRWRKAIKDAGVQVQ